MGDIILWHMKVKLSLWHVQCEGSLLELESPVLLADGEKERGFMQDHLQKIRF